MSGNINSCVYTDDMTTTQITSMQRHHLAQLVPNKQTALRNEMKSMREHMREVEQEMKEHKWESVAQLFNEIASMATELMVQAEANHAVTDWLHK